MLDLLCNIYLYWELVHLIVLGACTSNCIGSLYIYLYWELVYLLVLVACTWPVLCDIYYESNLYWYPGMGFRWAQWITMGD